MPIQGKEVGAVYWPSFESAPLSDLVKSLKKRSKALKHKTETLSCERVLVEEGSVRVEKFELVMSSYRRVALRFFLWEDGWAWVDARQPSKKGWVWVWTYEGKLLGRYGGKEVEEALEMTLDSVCETPAETLKALTQIWKPLLAQGPVAVT
ncbi:MAG: hypothetical protein MI785_06070 [Kiloniellales bacterium]|nr:hypothetical protein [Kiloniellales bacterium]